MRCSFFNIFDGLTWNSARSRIPWRDDHHVTALASPDTILSGNASALQGESMKRMNCAPVVVILGAVVAFAGMWGRDARAGEPTANRRCDDATVRGVYGIQISGTRPSAPGGPIESVVGVVLRHYDGHGQFTQVDNVKGSISGMVPDRQGEGTYQVNEDCSGIAQAQPGPGILLEERLVIVDGGNEIRSMTSVPSPVMVTGISKRRHTR
jgi:hypothetical protein